jgi:hypothetical protein
MHAKLIGNFASEANFKLHFYPRVKFQMLDDDDNEKSEL